MPYLVSDSFREITLLAAERCFSEQVRISKHRRERIVDFVRGASHKLAKRGQFFRFNQLLLQASKIFVRVARCPQQIHQFSVEHMLFDEYHCAHDHHAAKGQHQPKAANQWRRATFKQ